MREKRERKAHLFVRGDRIGHPISVHPELPLLSLVNLLGHRVDATLRRPCGTRDELSLSELSCLDHKVVIWLLEIFEGLIIEEGSLHVLIHLGDGLQVLVLCGHLTTDGIPNCSGQLLRRRKRPVRDASKEDLPLLAREGSTGDPRETSDAGSRSGGLGARLLSRDEGTVANRPEVLAVIIPVLGHPKVVGDLVRWSILDIVYRLLEAEAVKVLWG